MKYHIVNAFSRNNIGGNPAAVVVNQNLSGEEKQEAAKQIGFSETAFINNDDNRLFIEFFTPEKPISYCGHATIASVNILYQQQLVTDGHYILHTNENPIPVEITNGKVYMQQQYPTFHKVDLDEIAALLNTTKENIESVIITRNGVGYLLIELKDENILYHLKPDEKLVYNYSEKHDLIGIYPYTKVDGIILSRMFAPFYGIKEENATGMAAGLLGGWIHYQSGEKTKELFIEQGHSYFMKEKGYLHVMIEVGGGNKKILVGGEAVIRETVSDLTASEIN
ncbi:MAG: PhzF family phenazine biosynthesis protein [Sphingobacteriales bacterium]